MKLNLFCIKLQKFLRRVFKNEDVFFYSSLKNTGRKELLDFIEERINEKK